MAVNMRAAMGLVFFLLPLGVQAGGEVHCIMRPEFQGLASSEDVRVVNYVTALKDGDIEKIKAQLDNGLFVNFRWVSKGERGYYRGNTLLSYSVMNENDIITEFLLASGADPNLGVDDCGARGMKDYSVSKNVLPLSLLCVSMPEDMYAGREMRRFATAEILMRYGADPRRREISIDKQSAYGSRRDINALNRCGSSMVMIELFNRYGITVNDPAYSDGDIGNHLTLLMSAAMWRSPNSEVRVGKLLDLGADVAAKEIDGNTALHYAVEVQDLEAVYNEPGSQPVWLPTVKLLLEHGADPLEKNNQGITPLEKAKSGGASKEVIDILEKYVPSAGSQKVSESE